MKLLSHNSTRRIQSKNCFPITISVPETSRQESMYNDKECIIMPEKPVNYTGCILDTGSATGLNPTVC